MGYFAIDNRSPDLKHYGVLGMKWGVRRYENPDGTLTAAGKRRYARHEKNKAWRKQYKQDFKRVLKNSMNPKNHLPHRGITKEYIEGSIAMHPVANRIRYEKNLKKENPQIPKVITIADIQKAMAENDKEIARLKAKGVYPSDAELKRRNDFHKANEQRIFNDRVNWYMETFNMSKAEASKAVREDERIMYRRED